MKYKLIATDIDDTLLNSKKELTSATRSALIKAQKSGVKLVVASGRLPYGVLPYAKELEVFENGGYCMGFNGAAILNSKGELISKAHLDKKYLAPVFEMLRPTNVNIIVHKGDNLYTDTKQNPYTDVESRVVGLPLNVVENLEDFIDWDVPKLLLAGELDTLKAIEIELKAKLGDEVDIYFSAPWFLEVMPKGVSKGEGLKLICEDMGIDISEAVAFGDSFNDMSMIKAAGMGIAMGNAEDELKAVADMVTADCNSDGIATALKHLNII